MRVIFFLWVFEDGAKWVYVVIGTVGFWFERFDFLVFFLLEGFGLALVFTFSFFR